MCAVIGPVRFFTHVGHINDMHCYFYTNVVLRPLGRTCCCDAICRISEANDVSALRSFSSTLWLSMNEQREHILSGPATSDIGTPYLTWTAMYCLDSKKIQAILPGGIATRKVLTAATRPQRVRKPLSISVKSSATNQVGHNLSKNVLMLLDVDQ